MKKMEDGVRKKDKKGKKNEHRKKKMRKNIKYFALYIIPILTLVATILFFYIERKENNDEKAERELQSLPQLAARLGETIPFGMGNIFRISVENRNEQNVITSGTFTVQYMMSLKMELGIEKILIWRETFVEPEVEYDETLKGCNLYIKDDFLIHEDEVKKLFEEKKMEIVESDSYAFCCFRYTEAGEEKTVYYLISLELYKNCKVIVVKDPSVYTNGTLMNP